MNADNIRSEARMRLTEVSNLNTRASQILKQMEQTGIGAPGPFQQNGKWYRHTDKGFKEVTPTMAQRWLDLNHEYTQLQNLASTASQEYQALVGRTGAPASPDGSQPSRPRIRYTNGQVIVE